MSFKDKLIRMDILLGILILGVGIVMVKFNPSKDHYSSVMEFTRDYVFFNLTHVFFTFILLFSFKEMRMSLNNWAKRLHSNENFALFFVPLLIMTVLFISGAHYVEKIKVGQSFKYLIILLALFVPFFHSVRQHYGLMSFYFSGRGVLLRYGHFALLALYFIALLMSSKGHVRYGELPWIVDGINVNRIHSFAGVLMIIISVGIAIESLLDGGEKKIGKFLYSLRFFIYPIAVYTPLAGYLIGMVHGIEYTLFLGPLFLKNFGGRYAIYYAAAYITLTTIAGLSFSSFLRFYPIGGVAPYSIQLLSAAYFTFLYLHYLIDALLFRFSKIENLAFAKLVKG